MSRKFLKKGFSQTELLATIAVLGCIFALGIGMFNASKMNSNIEQTRQARLDSTIRTATMSVLGTENKLPASQACDANSLRSLLKAKIAGATDASIKVNNDDTVALRVKGLGTIAIEIADNCQTNYVAGTSIPIALYTSPKEDISELSVPDEASATKNTSTSDTSANEDKDSESEPFITPAKTSSNNTPDVVAYALSSEGVKETYAAPTTAEIASSKSAPPVLDESGKTSAPKQPLPNHDENICKGTYTNPAGDFCKETHLNVAFYQTWNQTDGCDASAPGWCQGNGIAKDGSLILTGKVNDLCALGDGSTNSCQCPRDENGQSFWWVSPTFYTIEGQNGNIEGMCVKDCTDFDPHMVTSGKNCICDKANGYSWDATLKKCTKPGECPEEYLTWDEASSTCVCDETYVRGHLASDEIYTGNASEECKKKCDIAYEPNEDQTICVEKKCQECLKEINFSDGQCYCKKADDLNNASLQQCNVKDNQYYTGIGTCVSDCADPYNSYKVRDTQNITSCVCQATKPAGMTLGAYEVYDPSETMTCRKCDTNYPNREYNNDIGPGSCECKDINDPTLQMGANQYYDPTKANCVETCPQGEVPNPQRTGCQPDCGCLEKLVNGVCVCNTEITTAEIQACKDFKGDIFDPNSPTCQTPCNGTSHADATLKECVCDGCAEKYNGYTCVCDEATSIAHQCVKPDEKYDPSVASCKSCKSLNRNYNSQGVCECKPASQIEFSDVNMRYDITQPNCEAPCAGILIRDINNPAQCVCPSVKPDNFIVNAGYHYNNLAITTGCVSPCPQGDYCPGSNPNNPSQVAIDPQDPNPTIDTTYPEGDVYKCPCGTYGSTQTLATATCSGLCPAGSKCTAPGTITPTTCSGSELCMPGVMHQCNPSTCSLPMVPNANHTACVCSASKPSSYSLPAGYKYDSNQPNCIKPCPAGDYCPGSKPNAPSQPNIPTVGTDPLDPNPTMDGNDPFAYKCPCGKYSNGSIDSKTSACIGDCYKGYYCTKGSTTPTQHECTASQKCPVGLNTCIPESCNLPMVPNADQTACVCAESKPTAYSLPAGYKYDKTAVGCIIPCPAGDYCPGSKPNAPSQPNIPSIGTDPLDPSPVMDGNDPFTYKCPCGRYSDGSTNSKTSACIGQCAKGYYCTKGSTTPTQNKCTSQQKCPTGLNTCYPDECTTPYVPNSEQTTCVCGLNPTPPAGKYFKADTCEYIDCPIGHYCPGPDEPKYPNPEPDPKYPGDVIYCPCGMYQDVAGSSDCKSDCLMGYYCPKGSTSNKGYVNNQEHKCTSQQKCPVGTCQPNTCTVPMVPNADQTACVCSQTRPSGYAIRAGYKYSPSHPEAGCMVACPPGAYCPGSKPNQPDVPNVPTGTVSTPDDPFVFTCPCGTYSSGGTTSIDANCMGKCTKGYYCTQGSTTPTQNKCTAQQKCPTGLNTCQPQSCELPFVPSEDQTSCVCSASKPSAYSLPAGYKYDATQATCKKPCPAGDYCPGSNPNNPAQPNKDPNDPNPTQDGNDPFTLKCPCGSYSSGSADSKTAACMGKCALGYYCPKGSTSATPANTKCTSTQRCPVGSCEATNCNAPYIPNYDQTECICGLSPNNVPAGKYFKADTCEYVACPEGHYCPGSNPDSNPDPKPDPQYPTGVIYCPCGTYGQTTGLTTYACSGKCPIGYYCPQGTDNPQAHICQAGQACELGTCEPNACTFPTTSIAPFEKCDKCMTEANIKKQQADYFKKNEIWVNDVNKACKKCKSNMVPVPTGGCDCPQDKPYWYNEECNSCENLGKLYFARNDIASNSSKKELNNCTLIKFLKGDKACFVGSDGRVIPEDMKAMADKLVDADKNKTFDNVFAYVIAEKSNEAHVVGVFTISSWYASFPSDFVSEDESTFADNRVKGTCSQMCAGINSQYSNLCVSTCEKFKDNTNSMFAHCAYAVNNKQNPQFIGQSYGNRADELCTNGEIKLANNCVYDIGNTFRKRSSPLVLDLLNDGFVYTSVEEGVIFDLDKDGVAEQTAWLAPQTEFDNAFLILDKNKNGQVDNGGELFGDQNGEENGFKELAKYDSNGDKLINKDDPIYAELRLWADMNKNAKIDYEADGTSKEIKTLEEAGITEISTDYQKLLDKKGNVLEDMYGNLVGIMGQFKMMVQNAAGKLVEVVRKVMDVFFVTK